MTKDQAVYAYFKRYADIVHYGVYAENSVPTVSTLPYMTYTYSTSEMGGRPVAITVQLWNRTTSEVVMNYAAETLRNFVKRNNYIVCDEGVVYIWTGEPFSIAQAVADDPEIKMRYINLTFDFCTE